MRTFLCQFWEWLAGTSVIIGVLGYILIPSPSTKLIDRLKDKRCIVLIIVLASICFGARYTYDTSVKVTSVVGLPIDLARQTMQKSGLNVELASTSSSGKIMVKRQTPEANVYVPSGSTVTLFLGDDVQSPIMSSQEKTLEKRSLSLQFLVQNYIFQETSKRLLSEFMDTSPFEDRFTLSEDYRNFDSINEKEQDLLKQLYEAIKAKDNKMHALLKELQQLGYSNHLVRTIYDNHKIEYSINCEFEDTYIKLSEIEIRPQNGTCYYCALFGDVEEYISGECSNWNWNGEYQGTVNLGIVNGFAQQGKVLGDPVYRSENGRIIETISDNSTYILTPIERVYDSEEEFTEDALWD